MSSEAEEASDEEIREWELAQARRAGRYDDGTTSTATRKSYIPIPSECHF